MRPADLARLPGLSAHWSRTVEAPDADGVPRRWHLLDTGYVSDDTSNDADDRQLGVMLCVHGNPTWSYLWRRFLSQARPGWRVIAVDQLGMGWSDRAQGSLDEPRRAAQRVADLTALTTELGLDDIPVVAVGHDWGGIVVTGWAIERHRRGGALAGLVLANTTVHHDFEAGLPTALKLARSKALHGTVTVRTPTFVRAASGLSRPALPKTVRDAFALPYRSADARDFVGQFVADIPTEPDHPTRATFEQIAGGLTELRDVPALLLRGPRDPVFSEAHLADLRARLPHAEVHRYEGAGHLVTEDAPRTAIDTWRWVADEVEPRLLGEAAEGSAPQAATEADQGRTDSATADGPAWSALLDRVERTPDEIAIAEVASGRRLTFAELEHDIATVAAGLSAVGIRPGERVALLVTPGIDLTVTIYAVWRLGAVVVLADAGLGLPGMGRALRGAGPAHLIAIAKGLLAGSLLRVPGQRILVGPAGPRGGSSPGRQLLGAEHTLDQVRALGAGRPAPALPPPDAECAVLFTSGATGPSKGVVYRTDQIKAQADGLRGIYGLTEADRFVAAFAPFGLYGPAMGVASVVPDMDVTSPSTLTASALADAVLAVDATTLFASPASLRNIVATAGDLDEPRRQALGQLRVAMSAGAPIPVALLRKVAQVLPAAELHTPYGMTECLPVSDVTAQVLEDVGPGNGVCVGQPLPGVDVEIAPLPTDPDDPDGDLTTEAEVTGEIVVSAAHVKDHYDQLWAVQQDSTRDGMGRKGPRHRTGDVGHLDEDGRLWVEGRRVHVVHTAVGPLTPYALEQRVHDLPGVAEAAVVGVGPIGTQAVVVIIRPDTAPTTKRRKRSGGPTEQVLADPETTAAIRALAPQVDPRLEPPAGPGVAAVLKTDAFPVDIRHQSKVDRARLASWADQVLAGGPVGQP